MSDETANPTGTAASGSGTVDAEPPRELTAEAKRALAEAEERRRLAAELAQNGTSGGAAAHREIGGRKGPEPTRFGDWEKGGIASDF
jgi:hypothetical protein